MSTEITRAQELRELADSIDALNTLKVSAERAGLLIDEAFLTEFKKLESRIQTELTNTIKDFAK